MMYCMILHCSVLCVDLFQAGLTQKWEAAGMSSMEGEYVEFGHAVYLEGPVEVRVPALLHSTSNLYTQPVVTLTLNQ